VTARLAREGASVAINYVQGANKASELADELGVDPGMVPFAEEIQIELMQMTTGQPVLTPEATGYMLRGFFEGLRRHVRHERELVAALGPTSPIASGSGSSAAH